MDEVSQVRQESRRARFRGPRFWSLATQLFAIQAVVVPSCCSAPELGPI